MFKIIERKYGENLEEVSSKENYTSNDFLTIADDEIQKITEELYFLMSIRPDLKTSISKSFFSISDLNQAEITKFERKIGKAYQYSIEYDPINEVSAYSAYDYLHGCGWKHEYSQASEISAK